MTNVLPLDSIDGTDPEVLATVGGKAAGLATLIAGGLPVPAGFCLTTSAYREFVAAADLSPQIAAALGDPALAIDLAGVVGAAEVPPALAAEIAAAYGALSSDGVPVAVAVRSSATAEDLPGASFAGQQDTYLAVTGTAAVIESVRRCWGSLWNDHAVAYRRRAGIEGADEVAMAVVVQRLVDADAAGVCFTADPVTGVREHVVINATWGLGEALVGGEVTPDLVVVDARTGATVRNAVATKHVMTVRTASGTELRDVPAALRDAAVLSASDVATLLDHARAVQRLFGVPMDIEWARADHAVWILQARPITSLPDDLMGLEWSRDMLIERYPDPVTPFTWSIVSDTFFTSLDRCVRDLGGSFPAGVPLVRRLRGCVYLNVDAFQQGMGSLGFRPPVDRGDRTDVVSSGRTAREGVAALRRLARLVRLVLGTHRDWDRRLPAYRTATLQAREIRWADLTARGLRDALLNQGALVTPMLDNHARSIVAGDVTLQLLRWLTTHWLTDVDGHAVLTLLSGLSGNITVETNHELWRLADHVRRHPGVAALVAAGVPTRADLAEVEGGPEFADRFEAFLTTYGHRSPRYEARHPTWSEDPAAVVTLLRLLLAGGADPRESEAAAARTRESFTAAARRRLPLPKRVVFDAVLSLTQTYFRLRENQQFHLVLGNPAMRAMLAEIGVRLVRRGHLASAGDVYLLERDEIAALLGGLDDPGDPAGARATRALIAARTAELERHAATRAPRRLGGSLPAAPTEVGLVRHGTPASRGTATGRARIVRGPQDFGSVRPGEILVAPATTPAWTPLFGLVAGLVTEHGGLLSHSSVVAREYGLPAVVGVPDALAFIPDGAEVTVDGESGAVTVHATA